MVTRASLSPGVNGDSGSNKKRKSSTKKSSTRTVEPYNTASPDKWIMPWTIDQDRATRTSPDNQRGSYAYKPTQSGTGLFGEIGNFFTDISRNTRNFIDTDLFGNRRPIGGAMGDAMFGSVPGISNLGRYRDEVNRTKGRTGPTQRPKNVGGGDEGWTPRTFEEIYAALTEQLGGIGSETPFISYDPVRQSTRSQADFSRSAIGSMYDQLAEEISGSNQRVNQRYQDASGELDASGNQGAAAVQNVYGQAQADNSEMLRKLGIEDAIAQTIEEGRDLAGQGADRAADVRTTLAADQAYNTANQNSANTYGERLQTAGETARTTNLGGLEQELSRRLAEIDMAEAQANQDAGWRPAFGPDQIASMAMDMQGADQQSYLDYIAMMQEQAEAQAAAQAESPEAMTRRAAALMQAMGFGNDPTQWEDDTRQTLIEQLLRNAL